jgi:hypothetical protein
MKQLRSYRRLICEASASTTVDNLFSLSLSLSLNALKVLSRTKHQNTQTVQTVRQFPLLFFFVPAVLVLLLKIQKKKTLHNISLKKNSRSFTLFEAKRARTKTIK